MERTIADRWPGMAGIVDLPLVETWLTETGLGDQYTSGDLRKQLGDFEQRLSEESKTQNPNVGLLDELNAIVPAMRLCLREDNPGVHPAGPQF